MIQLALAVLVVGIQLGIGLSLLTYVLPKEIVNTGLHLFIKHREGISPEYELTVYRTSIVLTFALAVTAFLIFKRYLNNAEFKKKLSIFTVATVWWLLVQTWGIFHWYTVDNSVVNNVIVIVGFIGQGACWLFFPELLRVVGIVFKQSSVIVVLMRQLGTRLANIYVTIHRHGWLFKIIVGLIVLCCAWILCARPWGVGQQTFLGPLRTRQFMSVITATMIPVVLMWLMLSVKSWGWRFLVLMAGVEYVRFLLNPFAFDHWIYFLMAFAVMLWIHRRSIVNPCAIEAVLLGVSAVVGLWTVEHYLGQQVIPEAKGLSALAVFIVVALTSFLINRQGQIYSRLLIEAMVVFLMSCAMFKAVIYDYRSALAWQALAILSAFNIIFIAFANHIISTMTQLWSIVMDERYARLRRASIDLGMGVFIVLLIWVPDVEAVVARIFIGEQYHHIDNGIVAQAWTVASGGTINIDTMSQYGVGLPSAFGWITKHLTGFGYVPIVQLVITLIIAYYLLAYIFLRVWFNNIPVAIATWLIGFKMQMFYTLSFPCILTYPQSTVIRGFWDVPCLLLLLLGLTRGNQLLFYLSALVAGIGCWWITSTGVYLIAAVFVGIWLFDISENKGRWFSLKACAWIAAASLIGVLLMWLTVGASLLTSAFWKNTQDFIKVFTSGYYSAPFWDPMRYQQYWDLLIAVVLMISLTFTPIMTAYQALSRKVQAQAIIALILSLYGLGLFEHWVTMTLGNNYYSKALPYVWVMGWLGLLVSTYIPTQYRRNVSLTLVLSALFIVLTNHHFMSYPNLINRSNNPITDLKTVAQVLPTGYPYFFHKYRQWGEDRKLPTNNLGQTNEGVLSEYDFANDAMLKRYYRVQMDFSQDVALIQRHTKQGDKVPLLSSFETAILMQANRRPFFFVFPFLESRPMTMRFFEVDQLFAQEHLDFILNQIRAAKPPFFFMEKIFLNKEIPKRYDRDTPGLLGVLNEVNEHYEVIESGQYLVALKRR